MTRTIEIRSENFSPNPWADGIIYQIAGFRILVDHSLVGLEAFQIGRTEPAVSPQIKNWIEGDFGSRLIYQGPGLLGGETRTIQCWLGATAYHLKVSGIGYFQVSCAGDSIKIIKRDERAEDTWMVEALLGPALSLAFAQHGVWCLHASAALYRDQLVFFLGESGQGKSTLADYLGALSSSDWRVAADDTLPVEISELGLHSLLHYPQAKYPSDRQPWLGLPGILPVHSVYILESPGSPDGAPIIQRLSAAKGTLNLVRHTVASRLFDPGLLARHLAFCSLAARSLPVRRLTYPRQYEKLKAVRFAIESDLAT